MFPAGGRSRKDVTCEALPEHESAGLVAESIKVLEWLGMCQIREERGGILVAVAGLYAAGR